VGLDDKRNPFFSDHFKGRFTIPIQAQRIEEYTRSLRILYDSEGNETARSSYDASENSITVNGVNEDGKPWSFSFEYLLRQDSLILKHDGGFESYTEFLIRLK